MGAFNEEIDRSDERSLEVLRRIVRYQRWLIAVVLGQLALWALWLFLSFMADKEIVPMRIPTALTIALGGVGGVFVFLLSWEIRGGFAAIVFGLAAVFPLMGLVVLTLVNSQASDELRKHGITVGVFGASLADVEQRQSLYDDENAGW